MPPKKKVVKPRKSNNTVYEKQYDTVEESKLSPFQRAIRNKITLYMPNKKVKMRDPQFASTDAQRFVSEYEKKKFRDKVDKLGLSASKVDNLQYLPLEETQDPYWKDNAYYDRNIKEYRYNGVPARGDKYYPTFANVMYHEAAHHLDDSYGDISYLYPPFIDNNDAIRRLEDYTKQGIGEEYQQRANLIKNNNRLAYQFYHDNYPHEMFADIIADKYRMNVEGFYNSFGNLPFGTNHLKSYQNFLKRTTGFPWSRGMYHLYNWDKSKTLPDDDIYIKVMNDL